MRIGEFVDDGGLDLIQLLSLLWRGKLIISLTCVMFVVGAIIYALSLPNLYRSTIVLSPTEEVLGGGGLPSGLGGIASLAGIDLGSGQSSKLGIAIELLKSRGFATSWVAEHDLFVPLLAAKDWDPVENRLILDAEVYDKSSGEWTEEYLSNNVSLEWDAFTKYQETVRVSLNEDTGFISVMVVHYSPYLAQEWAQSLVERVNRVCRQNDIEEAEESIGFLSEQLEATPLADLRSVFYNLIEKQHETMMLAKVRDEYVFKTLDPAFLPELKFEPKRGLIVIVSALLGAAIGSMVVLLFAALGPEANKKDVKKVS